MTRFLSVQLFHKIRQITCRLVSVNFDKVLFNVETPSNYYLAFCEVKIADSDTIPRAIFLDFRALLSLNKMIDLRW